MSELIVILLSILNSASVLILVSLGLAIIFGLMGVINMAHGEFVMVGAFTAVTLVLQAGLPLALAILLAPLVCAVLGAVVEITLIRTLYGKRLLDTLLVTFGLSLVLFQLAVNIFGTTSPGISSPLGSFKVGAYSVGTYGNIALPLCTVALIVAIYFLFTKTEYGLFARATAQNPEMARTLGVNSSRVNLVTFMIGCGVAGLGGALISPLISVNPSMGQTYVAQAFLTVVVGGQAFLGGTAAASALLGTVSNLISQFLNTLWGIAGLMILAIVIIRILPTGLSGRWKSQI